jgi:uncharacterized membrane protein YhaH (DUF805 family)
MGAIKAIWHNLANLFNFNGRETRSQFWPYVALVVFLLFAGMAAIMLPEMSASMDRMQRFAAEHPEQATVHVGPGSYSISIRGNHPELMPDMVRFMAMMSACFVLIILLLATAVARRLHDRGKSGVWGLMPIPFVVFASIVMPKLFTQFDLNALDLGLFFALFLNNLLYLASLIFLIVLLCGASMKGENRYGPAHGT